MLKSPVTVVFLLISSCIPGSYCVMYFCGILFTAYKFMMVMSSM